MLDGCCIGDAWKGHETPWSVTEDFIAHSKSKAVARTSCLLLLVSMPPMYHRGKVAKFIK